MSLKQSIVVVNQYTVRTASGKGSRGSTPGQYVEQYMLRKGATETMTPVLRSDPIRRYVEGYMLRPGASEPQDGREYAVRYHKRDEAARGAASKAGVVRAVEAVDGLGGIGFGYGSASLSHDAARAAARDIQELFDRGRTVMKTVVSFSPEYLSEMGLVPPGFVCEKPGDYKGNLDQMRLRHAVMRGVERMASRRGFDDLRYVGVIQVDTDNVHVHLAMVDAGRGRRTPSGEQRGMLTDGMKSDLRRGIDTALDRSRTMRFLSSNAQNDRQNARCFVRRFTYEAMEQAGPPQFLLACLPDDRRLWRAGTNRQEMRKANAIAREYVAEVLRQPGSGYSEAVQAIDEYCRRRQAREGLSQKEYRDLLRRGQERLVDDCVNGVYQVLRSVPRDELRVRTPAMEAMAQDYATAAGEWLAAGDPVVEFGFKLRSYAGRLAHHKKEAAKYRDAARSLDKPGVDESARPFVDYLRFEAEYQAQLMAKYQHFLAFLPPDGDFREELEALLEYERRTEGMRRMRSDAGLRRMLPQKAEDMGLRLYGVRGGRYASTPGVLDRRQEAMDARLAGKRDALRERLSMSGMRLAEWPTRIENGPPYPFDEVKALDLHHLGYDFAHDIAVSKKNIDNFVEAADERAGLFGKAAAYLRRTGQDRFLRALPGRDVELMKAVADRLRGTTVLRAQAPPAGGHRSGRTFRLDAGLDKDALLAIRQVVDTTAELGHGYE